jgi:hypothetical protein
MTLPSDGSKNRQFSLTNDPIRVTKAQSKSDSIRSCIPSGIAAHLKISGDK